MKYILCETLDHRILKTLWDQFSKAGTKWKTFHKGTFKNEKNMNRNYLKPGLSEGFTVEKQ